MVFHYFDMRKSYSEYKYSYQPVVPAIGQDLWVRNREKREYLKKHSEGSHFSLLSNNERMTKSDDSLDFSFQESLIAKSPSKSPCLKDRKIKSAKDKKPTVGIKPFIPYSSQSFSANEPKISCTPVSPISRPSSAPGNCSKYSSPCSHLYPKPFKNSTHSITKCLICFKPLHNALPFGPFLTYGSYESCDGIGKKKTYNVKAPTRYPINQIHEHALLTWRKNHTHPCSCNSQDPHHVNCGCKFLQQIRIDHSPVWHMEI